MHDFLKKKIVENFHKYFIADFIISATTYNNDIKKLWWSVSLAVLV